MTPHETRYAIPVPKSSSRTPDSSAAPFNSGALRGPLESLTYAQLVKQLKLSKKNAGAIARLDAEAGVTGPTKQFAVELRFGFHPKNWRTDIGLIAVAATALHTTKTINGTSCPSISVLAGDVLQAVEWEGVQRRYTLMESHIAETTAPQATEESAVPTPRRRSVRL